MGITPSKYRLLCFLIFCMASAAGYGQVVPKGILFQALVRDPTGVPAKGRTIHIKDIILQKTPSGTVVYGETFVIQASDEGVFTITIGKGSKVDGTDSFSNIDWIAGPYFLNIKVAIEPSLPSAEWKADEQYVDMGTSQFWTVPFAFTAEHVTGFELTIKAADTSSMLLPYLRKSDTLSLSSRIDLKIGSLDTNMLFKKFLNNLDTASILSPYLRKTDALLLSDRIDSKLSITDTTSLLRGYVRNGAIAQFLDTSKMLSPYFRKSEVANLMSPFLLKADTVSLNKRIEYKLSFADTSEMLAGYVKKMDLLEMESNHSKTFVPIDTAALLNSFLRIIDTTAVLYPYLKILDSASMLMPYLLKSDTATLLESYLKKSDTGNILIPYLLKADTSSISHRIDDKLNAIDTTDMLSNYYRKSAAVTALNLKEPSVNKSTDPALGISDLLFPTQRAVKTYIDSTATWLSNQKINSSRIPDSSISLTNIKPIGSKKIIGNPADTSALPSEIILGPGFSFSGNTLNVTSGDGGTIDTFATDIKVTSTIGLGKYSQGQTIPSKGKTVSQMLTDALTQVIAPTYTSPSVFIMSIPGGGNVEIGLSLFVSLSANFVQNDGGSQISTNFSRNGTLLGSNSDNIASLTSTTSYSATVNYGQGPIKNNNMGSPDPAGQISAGSKTSASITFTPLPKRYWGYSSTDTPSDAEILAVTGGGSELSMAKGKGTFDINISGTPNYIFYVFPSSFGSLTSFSVGGFGSLPAFNLTVRSFKNANGYSQQYNIYVSKNTFASSVSNIVTN